MISPYTKSCRNDGRAAGTEDQLFDSPSFDQSAIPNPHPNTDNVDSRNNEVSAAFALDANIIPDFGPNTKAAIEAVETKHPNL